MLREVRGVLKATVYNGVTAYHFIHIHFCSFLFLSASLVFPGRLCSKAYQHILDMVGLSHAKVSRTYLIQFNGHFRRFIKTNLREINDKGLSEHCRFCWQQLFGLTQFCYITEVHQA